MSGVIQDAVDIGELCNIRRRRSRIDVAIDVRSRGGAIRLPQFSSGLKRERREVQQPADVRQTARREVASRSAVADHHRSGRRAVALPQLISVDTVIRTEVQRAADRGQVRRIHAACTACDILNHRRPGGCAITLPQFAAIDSVVS